MTFLVPENEFACETCRRLYRYTTDAARSMVESVRSNSYIEGCFGRFQWFAAKSSIWLCLHTRVRATTQSGPLSQPGYYIYGTLIPSPVHVAQIETLTDFAHQCNRNATNPLRGLVGYLHEKCPQFCPFVNHIQFCSQCWGDFRITTDLTSEPICPPCRRENERDKMTESLRFDVLERDDFRCQCCGRSPRNDDSVELHVDHIRPIAKGGKTEKPNLQALCQRCNLGKSDKRVEKMEKWGGDVD